MQNAASEAARGGALVVERGERGTISVVGPDRVAWLNGIATCDVGRVTNEVGAFGLVLTRQGKIVTDLLLVADAGRLLASVKPGQGAAILEYLDRMLVMEDAELEEATAAHAWFELHGPAAAACAREVAGAVAGASGSVDRTGLGGAALVVPRARREEARALLTAQAGVAWASAEDWLRLRLERAVPEIDVDYGADDTPHQARLERSAVAWDKGCYLGQEVVCMLDMRGKVRRRLACVRLEAAVAPPRDAPVCISGRDDVVGQVTSSAVSTHLERGIAWARVQTAASEPGAALLVDSVPGVVVTVPDP